MSSPAQLKALQTSPNHGRLCHLIVSCECPLDLCGPYPVPADVDDVIHPACDPDVPVLVTPCSVPREVVPTERAKVGRLVAGVVMEECSSHAGPCPLHQVEKSVSKTGLVGFGIITNTLARLALIARIPSPGPWISCPSAVSSTGCTPKKGRLAEPGLSLHHDPGKGVIMWVPVSVCHLETERRRIVSPCLPDKNMHCKTCHVSMMGHRFSPTISWNHRHACSLIGSPTDPRTCREERSYLRTYSSPCCSRERSNVGAV